MCMSPIKLVTGVVVACGQCRICRADRVDDYVGRCLAEQRSASKTLSMTLTYKGDVAEAATLVYRDVQLMLKRLRIDGYRVRYLVAGEYGSRKGRAHWHIVLFFYGNSPELALNCTEHWKYWPHGHVFAQVPNYGGFRYLMKYVLKHDVPEVALKKIQMSKKPPLGYEFFRKLALDMVEQGLAFWTPEYAFAGVDLFDKERRVYRPRTFWLRGRMLEMMMQIYVDAWQDKHKRLLWLDRSCTDFLMEKHFDGVPEPYSDHLEKWLEQKNFAADLEVSRQEGIAAAAADRAEFEPVQKTLAFLALPGDGLVVLEHDGTLRLHLEGETWQLDGSGFGGGLVSQLQRVGLPLMLAQQVWVWYEGRFTRSPIRSIRAGG